MSCCCTSILQLCRVSVCGTDKIVTGVLAPADGNYKLVLDYLGVDVVINKTFTATDPLDFPSDQLNEDYKYTGKIIGPDGLAVQLEIEDVTYDCIAFQTGLSYNMNEEEEVIV